MNTYKSLALSALLATPGCLPNLQLPKEDLIGLEPEHQRCIQIYYYVRESVLGIMDDRNLSRSDLRKDYLINPINYADLYNVHPQIFENKDFCWVITSPLYSYTYRVLLEYPDGRDVVEY